MDYTGYLDKLIGDEGVKTDIQLSIPPSAFVYMGVALFVGMVASRVVSKAFLE